MLKWRVDSLEDVDENLRSLYEEDQENGGFVLKAEKPPKFKEFRETNKKLNKKTQELTQQMEELRKRADQLPEDFDLEKWKKAQEALEQVNKMKSQNLLEEGKVDEYVQERTKEMKESYEQQVEALQNAKKEAEERNKNYKTQLERLALDAGLTKAIGKAGVAVRKHAMDDLQSRASNAFEIDDSGKPRPRDGLIDTEGNKIESIEQYVRHLANTAEHLFVPGGGGGAGGDGGAGGKDGVRKIKRGTQASKKDLQDIASGKAMWAD